MNLVLLGEPMSSVVANSVVFPDIRRFRPILLPFFVCFLVSCSDDKTLRIWQCYEPGNQEGNVVVIVCLFVFFSQ